MPYIDPDVIAEAKKMDLLTYLQNYEPHELVQISGSVYCTRTHDSLKISNGKWCWHSHGIGGRSALDYLIKVNGMSFTDAAERITGRTAAAPPVFSSEPRQQEQKSFKLPALSRSSTQMINYLTKRGIDMEILRFCIDTGRLYESYPHHKAVFVGMDEKGIPRYAALRGAGFMGEATGSDKRYVFNNLKADPVSGYAYQNMFQNCTSLVNAPQFPGAAATVAANAAPSMYAGCTALVYAPNLPYATLGSSCFQLMFDGCTSLAYLTVGFPAWTPINATTNRVRNVASAGTFTDPAALPETVGNNNQPTGWTRVNV